MRWFLRLLGEYSLYNEHLVAWIDRSYITGKMYISGSGTTISGIVVVDKGLL